MFSTLTSRRALILAVAIAVWALSVGHLLGAFISSKSLPSPPVVGIEMRLRGPVAVQATEFKRNTERKVAVTGDHLVCLKFVDSDLEAPIAVYLNKTRDYVFCLNPQGMKMLVFNNVPRDAVLRIED